MTAPLEAEPDAAELSAFREWKAARDEDNRTSGRWCLTPEGRAEVRRIFGDDGSWLWVLFQEVERLEAELAADRAARQPAQPALCDDCGAIHRTGENTLCPVMGDPAEAPAQAPAAQAQQRSLLVDEALGHLQGLVELAYAQGFHELGYDPLEVVREALRAGWIACSERLPDEGQSIAFVVDCKNPSFDYLDGKVLGGTYRSSPFGGDFSVPGMTVKASHWMPLPQPPQGGSDSNTKD